MARKGDELGITVKVDADTSSLKSKVKAGLSGVEEDIRRARSLAVRTAQSQYLGFNTDTPGVGKIKINSNSVVPGAQVYRPQSLGSTSIAPTVQHAMNELTRMMVMATTNARSQYGNFLKEAFAGGRFGGAQGPSQMRPSDAADLRRLDSYRQAQAHAASRNTASHREFMSRDPRDFDNFGYQYGGRDYKPTKGSFAEFARREHELRNGGIERARAQEEDAKAHRLRMIWLKAETSERIKAWKIAGEEAAELHRREMVWTKAENELFRQRFIEHVKAGKSFAQASALASGRGGGGGGGGGAIGAFGGFLSSVGSVVGGLSRANAYMIGWYLTARRLATTFTSIYSWVIKTNQTIESTRLGIAQVALTAGKFVDATTKAELPFGEQFQVALNNSQYIIDKLLDDSIKFGLNFKDTVKVFPALIGPALRVNATLDQTVELTRNIALFSAKTGIQNGQVVRTIDNILKGVRVQNTELGSTLGLTNAQVQAWKQSGKLVEELSARLHAITDTLGDQAKTYEGLRNSVETLLFDITQQASLPLFERAKEFLENVRQALDELRDDPAQLKEISKAIDSSFGTMLRALEYLIDHAGGIASTFNILYNTPWWARAGGPIGIALNYAYESGKENRVTPGTVQNVTGRAGYGQQKSGGMSVDTSGKLPRVLDVATGETSFDTGFRNFMQIDAVRNAASIAEAAVQRDLALRDIDTSTLSGAKKRSLRSDVRKAFDERALFVPTPDADKPGTVKTGPEDRLRKSLKELSDTVLSLNKAMIELHDTVTYDREEARIKAGGSVNSALQGSADIDLAYADFMGRPSDRYAVIERKQKLQRDARGLENASILNEVNRLNDLGGRYGNLRGEALDELKRREKTLDSAKTEQQKLDIQNEIEKGKVKVAQIDNDIATNANKLIEAEGRRQASIIETNNLLRQQQLELLKEKEIIFDLGGELSDALTNSIVGNGSFFQNIKQVGQSGGRAWIGGFIEETFKEKIGKLDFGMKKNFLEFIPGLGPPSGEATGGGFADGFMNAVSGLFGGKKTTSSSKKSSSSNSASGVLSQIADGATIAKAAERTTTTTAANLGTAGTTTGEVYSGGFSAGDYGSSTIAGSSAFGGEAASGGSFAGGQGASGAGAAAGGAAAGAAAVSGYVAAAIAVLGSITAAIDGERKARKQLNATPGSIAAAQNAGLASGGFNLVGLKGIGSGAAKLQNGLFSTDSQAKRFVAGANAGSILGPIGSIVFAILGALQQAPTTGSIQARLIAPALAAAGLPKAVRFGPGKFKAYTAFSGANARAGGLPPGYDSLIPALGDFGQAAKETYRGKTTGKAYLSLDQAIAAAVLGAAADLGLAPDDAYGIGKTVTKNLTEDYQTGGTRLLAARKRGKLSTPDLTRGLGGLIVAYKDLTQSINGSVLAQAAFTKDGLVSLNSLERAADDATAVITNGVANGLKKAVESGNTYDAAQSLAETFSDTFINRVAERLAATGTFGTLLTEAVAYAEKAAEALARGDTAAYEANIAKANAAFGKGQAGYVNQVSTILPRILGENAYLGIYGGSGVLNQTGAGIPTFATGTMKSVPGVPGAPSMAIVHGGEKIYNPKYHDDMIVEMRRMRSSVPVIYVQVSMDGKEIAGEVKTRIDKRQIGINLPDTSVGTQ